MNAFAGTHAHTIRALGHRDAILHRQAGTHAPQTRFCPRANAPRHVHAHTHTHRPTPLAFLRDHQTLKGQPPPPRQQTHTILLASPNGRVEPWAPRRVQSVPHVLSKLTPCTVPGQKKKKKKSRNSSACNLPAGGPGLRGALRNGGPPQTRDRTSGSGAQREEGRRAPDARNQVTGSRRWRRLRRRVPGSAGLGKLCRNHSPHGFPPNPGAPSPEPAPGSRFPRRLGPAGGVVVARARATELGGSIPAWAPG